MAIVDWLSSFFYLHALILIGRLVAHMAKVVIVRLYYSPICHIPGPKLAAATWLYEFYYDIVLGGQYTFKIIELHKKYGPIIRINPEEVHVGDADFFPELYPGSARRRDKTPFYVKQFGAPESTLSTIDHNLHRLRRTAINPFFSAQSVRKLHPVISERADALLERLRGYSETSTEPLNLIYPFSAFANDVINECSFARCHHLIEDTTFGKAVTDSLLTGTHYGKWIQHIEIILKFINALPEFISARFVPGWRGFLKMKKDILRQIASIKETENTDKWQLDVPHPTIFHEMLSSRVLPPREKTVSRLSQDGQILVQGGTLTTSWALAIATFHLLSRPACLRRLRDELCTAIPDPHDPIPAASLERLPYLRAVVKETLRLSVGTSGRLARVAPDETLTYVDDTTDPSAPRAYRLPPGTPVSMTPYHTVTNPAIFPDPLAFRPERWLGKAGVGDGQGGQGEEGVRHLERHLTVFGGGARICLGMALAQAELHLVLAKLFRVWGGATPVGEGGMSGVDMIAEENVEGEGYEDCRLGDVGVMRVYQTTTRDTQMAADYFIPIPWKGTRGIRVVFEAA